MSSVFCYRRIVNRIESGRESEKRGSQMSLIAALIFAIISFGTSVIP